jgi:hypothetical protein
MYVVFYATVNEGENGTEIQSPFLGGIVPGPNDADLLAHDIVNDKSISGAVIPKILGFNKIDEFKKKYDFTVKHFAQMTVDIHDYEMTQKRMRQKK